jgi:hypothetical protein
MGRTLLDGARVVPVLAGALTCTDESRTGAKSPQCHCLHAISVFWIYIYIAYKAEAPWYVSARRVERRYDWTYGNDIDELGGNDSLSTSVVLQLQGSNHVVGVLYISNIPGINSDRLTLEAFSMAVRRAEISAA